MLLVSQVPNYVLTVNVGGKNLVLRFNEGELDTAVEAKRLGVAQKDLDKAVRASKSFNVRFMEKPEPKPEPKEKE